MGSRRQVLGGERLARRRECDRALDGVAQLSHVAREVALRERVEEVLAQRDPRRVLATELLCEVLGEEGDVDPAPSQGRHGAREGVEAVEEVLAEAPVLDPDLQIAMRGGHDAHVDHHALVRSDGAQLARLEHAEQLDLESRAHLGDLVEEERAAVGLLEEALAVSGRAGEGAPAVAEELRLEQVFGDGAAVHGHERPLRPRALLVDGARHQLLAGARLAEDQHRHTGGGHPADLLGQLADGRAHAEQRTRGPVLGAGGLPPAGRRQPVEQPAEQLVGERLVHHLLGPKPVQRLGQHVFGLAVPHQRQRLSGRESGQPGRALEVPVRVDAAEHEQRGAGIDEAVGVVKISRMRADDGAPPAHPLLELATTAAVARDHEDRRLLEGSGHRAIRKGRRMVKALPPPAGFDSSMVPW